MKILVKKEIEEKIKYYSSLIVFLIKEIFENGSPLLKEKVKIKINSETIEFK
jgi:hypothetical protein